MEVQEIEETIVEDKRVEEMTPEELQRAYDSEVNGETQEVPETEEVEVSAEDEIADAEPKDEVDSDNDTTEEESKDDPIKSLSKQMEGMQKLLSKWGTEMGELRKFKDSMQKEQSSQEEEDVDPYIDPDAYFEKKLVERESKMAQQRQTAENQVNETKAYVTSRVPKFDDMVGDMASELKRLLADEPDADLYVENFKANPYVVDPLTLLFAGRTAELNKEIAQLKESSKTANGKGDLVQKIKSLGKNRAVVTGGNNGGSNSNVRAQLTRSQIQSQEMTPDKLKQLYKQLLEQQQ